MHENKRGNIPYARGDARGPQDVDGGTRRERSRRRDFTAKHAIAPLRGCDDALVRLGVSLGSEPGKVVLHGLGINESARVTYTSMTL